MKISLAAALLALPLVAAPAFAEDAPSGEPIKIGVISELSGPYSFFGQSCVAGFRFAETEINASGGILHRPLKLIIVDNQTSPGQSIAAARAADTNDQVVAITGPTSSDNALALYGYVEQNHLPFIVPVAAFPQLTKPGTHWTFRMEPDAVGFGHAAAQFIAELKPGARVAIAINDYAVSRAAAAGFKYQAARSGLVITDDMIFPQNTTDATIQAAQIAAHHPDYVYFNTVGAFDAIFGNELLDLGFKPEQLVRTFGITTGIKSWGPRAVGSIYGTFFDKGIDNLNDAGHAFISAFTAANNRPPSYVENFCYTTPFVFKAAIEAAGSTDRQKLRDAISALVVPERTTGKIIRFDQNGARTGYGYFMRLTGQSQNDYQSKQLSYREWSPEEIPAYDIVK